MKPSRWYAWMVGVSFGLLWGAQAEARDSPQQSAASGEGAAGESSDSATRRMMLLNEQGFEAFERGDYADAAHKFEAAHRLVPDPILRKNAAIAWFKADRCREAREAAIFFLVAEGTVRQDRLEARSVLTHCRLNDAAAALEVGDTTRASQIVAWAEVLQTDEQVQLRLDEMRQELAGGRYASESATPLLGWTLIGMGAAVLASSAALHLSLPDGQQDWPSALSYGVGALSAGSGLWLVVSSRETPGAANLTSGGIPASSATLELGWAFRY